MRRTCAVDFDGTLCDNKFPEIGEPHPSIIEYVQDLQREGWAIILWTCREGQLLEDAVNWCSEKGITFDAINANLPERTSAYGSDCRKIGADVYLDDRSMHPFRLDQLMKSSKKMPTSSLGVHMMMSLVRAYAEAQTNSDIDTMVRLDRAISVFKLDPTVELNISYEEE